MGGKSQGKGRPRPPKFVETGRLKVTMPKGKPEGKPKGKPKGR